MTGIVSTIAASQILEEFKKSRYKKPLNAVLNLGRTDLLLFVFPERTDLSKALSSTIKTPKKPPRILPFAASEDFLAINNIKSALLKINWHGKDKIKQPGKLSQEDKEQFIFSIGSKFTNTFTAEVENVLISLGKNIYRAVESKNFFQCQIIDRAGTEHISKTYDQVDRFLLANNNRALIPEQEYIDFGYLTKVTNPFSKGKGKGKETKIFIVAGIRGIGTWGVAECLKKNLVAIYKKLGEKKDIDFSAAIKIHYRNLDILDTTVMSVNEL